MSRSIAESVSLLSETLGNCKTNLKEKEVADVDNIKISDVDEKIAEIKSGGGFDEINILLKSINQENRCLVLAKGCLNDSDSRAEIYSLNYGENLGSSIRHNDYIQRFGGTPYNLYIGFFPCHWNKIKFVEYQDADYGMFYGNTGDVDVSQPGVICVEMKEQ